MKTQIDFSSLTPASRIKGEDKSDTMELQQMLGEASEFLASHSWCKEILEAYLGIGVSGVIGVFLMKIAPAQSNVDEWLWVIVGDLPSAYIVTDDAPNSACALKAYIAEMRNWVNAVKNGRALEGVIPVMAEPNLENANGLAKRLDFLQENILNPFFSEDSDACQ